MKQALSYLLDNLSEFLAHRKGLLLIVGLLFVIANAVLQFIPAAAWFAQTDLLLHLGIIIAVLGVLLAWAL